jgi:hypothetical protein
MAIQQLSFSAEPSVSLEYVPDAWGGTPVPSKPHFAARIGAWAGWGATPDEALVDLARRLREHAQGAAGLHDPDPARSRADREGRPPLSAASQLMDAADRLDGPALIARLRRWAAAPTLASDGPE